MNKKILFSGVKPTGRPHIGNYFGAMKQFVDLQNDFESRIFIPDLHSIISVQNGEELSQSTLDVAMDYLAIGLDPKNVTIFKQSDLPETTELAWIFSCLTTVPYLMRAHAVKDAEAKGKEVNVGLFNYPILMAADILIHNAHVVPVGKDQKQHIEIARDIAEKFNRIYCKEGEELIRMPEHIFKEEVEVVPGIDGQKMSKSKNNHIPLFAEDDEIKKLVMSIVTDSSGETPMNVYNIHKLFRTQAELEHIYNENKGKYKALKDKLAEDIIAFVTPLRERRKEIAKNPDQVRKMLAKNGEIMREKVHPLVYEIRKKVGLIV
jgi:tryptophanyl-tRNA synthetase